MNREELAEMATLTLDVHWPESEEYALDKAVAYLVEVVWPVLAQVWDEGHEAGFDDGRGTSAVWLEGEDRPNPYGEQP